jgi:hypothetical protein
MASANQTSETRNGPSRSSPVATSDVPSDAPLLEQWRVIIDISWTNAHWETKWKPRDAAISTARKWIEKYGASYLIRLRIERRVLAIVHEEDHDADAERDAGIDQLPRSADIDERTGLARK